MKILLIGPSFFGYCNSVASCLRQEGHEVTRIDDRPSESVLFRSLSKIDYSLVSREIRGYTDSLCNTIATSNYDLILYLGGMSFCFTKEQMVRIRSASQARMVCYLWDAIGNCKRIKDCLGLFDKVYSFEPGDCERYGLSFLPLFFDDAYRQDRLGKLSDCAFDACFIGSVHQVSKFKAISEMVNNLKKCGFSVFTYYYMPSQLVALYRKAFHPFYRNEIFEFSPMSKDEIAKIYLRSRAVIDSPQSGQDGLTIRTIEAFGSRRKIITTNPSIRRHDIFNKDNIFIVENGELPSSAFVNGEYFPYSDELYEKYSIRGFARQLLCDNME